MNGLNEDYLTNRAKRARNAKFKKALRKVADRKPVPGDERRKLGCRQSPKNPQA